MPTVPRDELDALPADMVAAILTERLGFLVTTEEVRADRRRNGLDPR